VLRQCLGQHLDVRRYLEQFEEFGVQGRAGNHFGDVAVAAHRRHPREFCLVTS
jgi:hypothetical protein